MKELKEAIELQTKCVDLLQREMYKCSDEHKSII